VTWRDLGGAGDEEQRGEQAEHSQTGVGARRGPGGHAESTTASGVGSRRWGSAGDTPRHEPLPLTEHDEPT
jgi:hypothetical protein